VGALCLRAGPVPGADGAGGAAQLAASAARTIQATAASWRLRMALSYRLGFALRSAVPFDGILVAAASFTVEKGGALDVQRVVTLIAIVMALVAAALCLLVARISYPFLDKVRITPGLPPGLDYSDEIRTLEGEVMRRTRYYRMAWRLSLAGLLPFLIMFLLGIALQTR